MANAKAAFQAVRKVKVYEGVARQIERLISEGSLKPGDKLPSERELAEMFRVSRSSLRDGIRKLELLGLVEARHGEGTIVRDLSADSLVSPIASMLVRKRQLVAELLDVRKMLEPPLAGRAATIIKVLDVLMGLLRKTRERSLQVGGRLQRSFAGHRRILRAIERRDAAAAEAAMRRHLEQIEEIIRKKMA